MVQNLKNQKQGVTSSKSEDSSKDKKSHQGPFNFNGRDVYFDRDKGEFWDPQNSEYLDHDVGLTLIDIYFGHHKAPLNLKNNKIQLPKKS